MAESKLLKILFLCAGNSCRSQMAEGWTRAMKGDVMEVYSAGIETHGLNQTAVEKMAEVGVDISTQTSKHVESLRHIAFDAVITAALWSLSRRRRLDGKGSGFQQHHDLYRDLINHQGADIPF